MLFFHRTFYLYEYQRVFYYNKYSYPHGAASSTITKNLDGYQSHAHTFVGLIVRTM